MKNIKKISVLMAIFTTTGLSHLIARPTGNNPATNSSQSHTTNPKKAIAGAALVEPSGGTGNKSKTAGAAALGSMASQSSGDSGGSGGSSGSSGAQTPTPTPTPTTPTPNEQSGQQYAQAPVTGVPTTVSNATPATTPVSDPTTATPAIVDKKNDQENNTEKKAEENKETTLSDGGNSVIEDQDAILEKIKEINHKDDIAHQALNQASMDLLFNNFLYFKNFIVKNFSKDKMLNLCIEFINQIYPSEQVKVISMNNSTTQKTPSQTPSTSNNTQETDTQITDTQATSDVAINQKPQDMPQEDNTPDNYPQAPSDIEPNFDEFDHNQDEQQE
jgi:hypothetical protein